MTPDDLIIAIRTAVSQAVESGVLAVTVPEDVVLDRPRNPEHGDYATNLALRLAKSAGQPPRAVAEQIAARLREADGVASVDVAGPGFLNITLDSGSLAVVAKTIVEAGADYGRSDQLAGLKVNLEFISANPTGPLHLGHTRWAAVGDSLGRVLTAAGAEVTQEL